MRRGDGSLYDIVVPGYKANLSDVLASIALVQLDKLEQHGEIRRRQFAAYDEAVAELEGIEPLARDDRDTHAYHLYVVRIDAERAGGTRDEYQRRLAEENIATSIHFLPVHTLTAYRERLPDQPPLPVAEKAAPRCCPAAVAGALGRRHRGRDLGTAPGPRLVPMSRSIRVALTLLVTGLCTAYVLWKIDIGKTIDVLAGRRPALLLPRARDHDRDDPPDGMALAADAAGEGRRGGHSLADTGYFVSYAAGQVLPTSVGGDAVGSTRRRAATLGTETPLRPPCSSSVRSAVRRR